MTTVFNLKRSLFALLYLVILFSLQAQNKTHKAVQFPENYNAQIDVVYFEIDNWQGRIDLYTNPNSVKPTPIVLNIHGGGWNHGEKESQSGFSTFFNEDYAVANVEYRLVDVAPAPAAIEDIRCALIYILKNAKTLNIDPNKIVVMGGSAGGHLALMAGLLGNNKAFDTNCEYDGDINVAAIIDKYGINNLVPSAKNGSVKRWLGKGYDDPKFVKSVSPLYYVSETSPPVFIIHGDADPIVSYEQSVSLHQKLKEANVQTVFITVKGGQHGKFPKQENQFFQEKLWEFLRSLNL